MTLSSSASSKSAVMLHALRCPDAWLWLRRASSSSHEDGQNHHQVRRLVGFLPTFCELSDDLIGVAARICPDHVQELPATITLTYCCRPPRRWDLMAAKRNGVVLWT